MGEETELEGLGVKRECQGESVGELGTGFEDEREGVEVRGERVAAEGGEEVEGGERGRKEGVDSDEVVVRECCWVWDRVE